MLTITIHINGYNGCIMVKFLYLSVNIVRKKAVDITIASKSYKQDSDNSTK